MGILESENVIQLGLNAIKIGKKIVSSVVKDDDATEMAKNRKKRSKAFIDEIRCDEKSYLIWKWHPLGTRAGENNRENAVRFGSSLRVKDGSVAVFVYNLAGGQVQDYIEGPFDQILATENLPGIADLFGAIYGGGTPFQAEIYFINLAERIQTRFAVPFFDIIDPRFPDIGVPAAVRGTITFRINDYREFVRLHTLDNFSLPEFQAMVKSAVTRYIKSIVLGVPQRYGISVMQIEQKTEEIIKIVEPQLAKCLKEDFGVTLIRLDIEVIEVDKTSEEFYELSRRIRESTQSSDGVLEE